MATPEFRKCWFCHREALTDHLTCGVFPCNESRARQERAKLPDLIDEDDIAEALRWLRGDRSPKQSP